MLREDKLYFIIFMHPTASSEEHFNQQIKISVRLHHYKEVFSIMKKKKNAEKAVQKDKITSC